MEIVDQDMLQLMDETNEEWVKAWKKAVSKNVREDKKPKSAVLTKH